MELKINSKTHDKYFDRTIISFQLKLGAKETAKLAEVRKALGEHVKEGFIVVYTMKNVYGSRNVNGIAQVYSNEEVAKKILQKHVLKKNGVVYAERKEEKAEAK